MKGATARRIFISPSSSQLIRLPLSIENSKLSCKINISIVSLNLRRRFEQQIEGCERKRLHSVDHSVTCAEPHFKWSVSG